MTNISEILKKCPSGTKLYSPICGECYLYWVVDKIKVNKMKVNGEIVVYDNNRTKYNFYKDGTQHPMGECLLFPSKDNRNWSTFAKESKFKPFDKVLVRDDINDIWRLAQYGFESEDNSAYTYNTVGGTWWVCCIPYEGNEHLLGTDEYCE